MHELKLLGDESLTGLVQFYSLVEATAKWPTAMQEVPVAALRKPTGTSPLDIRPIVLCTNYLQDLGKNTLQTT